MSIKDIGKIVKNKIEDKKLSKEEQETKERYIREKMSKKGIKFY